MKNLFGSIGRSFISFLQDLSGIVSLFRETLVQTAVLVRDPKRLRRSGILQQVDEIGAHSLTLVAVISALLGLILTVLSAANLGDLGFLNYVPSLVLITVFRFTAPLMTGVIVAGRMGAAFTARIGTMKATEEVLALEVMAISPVRYLVVQRFVGMVLSLPALTIFAGFSAVFVSFLYGVGRLGIPSDIYLRQIMDDLTMTDVLSGIVKSVIFAVVIAMIGCYRGLIVEGGAEAVGRATMITVVWSTLMVILLDAVMTVAFYG